MICREIHPSKSHTHQVGHHFVHSHLPGFEELTLDPGEGSSNHYRICEGGGFECLKRHTQV